MATIDPAAARHATQAVPSIPCDAEGPVFREPWEAQAAGDPDTGETYYRHWLNALERIVAARGLADTAMLARYRRAWHHAADRTPHGTPIELKPEDFR